MATTSETGHDIEVESGTENWIVGGIAGLIAGAVFGGIMSQTPMMESVAALITLQAVAAGWLFHFVISFIFGAIFAAIATIGSFPEYANRTSSGAGLGIAYGIIVWVVGAAIVMPLWMGAVTGASPPVPNLNWLSFAGHIAYGAVLGAFYPILLAYN